MRDEDLKEYMESNRGPTYKIGANKDLSTFTLVSIAFITGLFIGLLAGA